MISIVFLLTGYVADLDLLKACGVAVDPNALVPRHDPKTFETNVSGLYLAGSVVAGANRGEVFIENGRFHGEMVMKEIARRLAARRDTPRRTERGDSPGGQGARKEITTSI